MVEGSVAVYEDEALFLRLTRALLGFSPIAAARDVLEDPHRRVELSPNGLHVLKDLLAKGVVRALVRGGGYRTRRGPGPRGRLWERHEPFALRFSSATMDLLRGAFEYAITDAQRWTRARPEELTMADEVVFFCVARALRQCRRTTRMRGFEASSLVRIGFALDFDDLPAPPRFERFLEGSGALVVEALSRDLAVAVVDTERERRTLTTLDRARLAADAIARGPSAFVSSCIKANRLDLGLFMLEAVRQILSEMGSGAGPTRFSVRAVALSDRQRIMRGGLSLFESALLYRTIANRARAVGFVDDGYEEAQSLLSRLEPWTEGGFERVDLAVRELSSYVEASGTAATPAS